MDNVGFVVYLREIQIALGRNRFCGFNIYTHHGTINLHITGSEY